MNKRIAPLGVGLSYRPGIHDEILRERGTIDFLELIPDQFIYSPEESVAAILEELADFPVVAHSVNLSIGTVSGLDADYLARVARFVERTGSIYYSDHVCFTRVPGTDLGQLTPLQFTREMTDVVVRNVATVEEALGGVPFYLENISYYLDLPGAELSEAEFLTEIFRRTDCGMLLDVNNLWVNSVNRRYDPLEFLDNIPLERVETVHVAGFSEYDDLLLDSHDGPAAAEVWRLLERVVERAPVKAVIFEQDENLGDMRAIVEQLERARRILERAGRGAAAASSGGTTL